MSTADPRQSTTPTDPAAAARPSGPAGPAGGPPAADNGTGRALAPSVVPALPADDLNVPFDLTADGTGLVLAASEPVPPAASVDPAARHAAVVPVGPEAQPVAPARPAAAGFGEQAASIASILPDESGDLAGPIELADTAGGGESSEVSSAEAPAEPPAEAVFPPDVSRSTAGAEQQVEEPAVEQSAGAATGEPAAHHLTAAEWLAAQPADMAEPAGRAEPVMPDHPPTPGETPDGSADLSDLWVSSGRAGGGDAAGEAGGKAVESGAGDVKARGEAWNEAAAADVPTESPAGDQAAEPLDVPSEVSAGATATPPAVEAPGEAVSAVVVPSTADELTAGEPTAESASAAAAAATLPLEPPTAEPISVPVAPDAEAVAVEATSLPTAEPAMKEPAALPRAMVTAAPPSPEGVGATASPEAEARREFLKKALAVMAGGVAVGVPVAIAVRAFTDPLGGTAAAAAGFLPITTLDALKDEGRPYSFPVVADKTDAWNKYRNVRVGAVYLIRHDKDVAAFTAVCPHAGCFVDVAAPGGPEMFRCPCHRSSFAADGSVVPGSVSPRGLDRLDVDPEALKRGEVRVRFQNFVAGTADKVPVG